MEQRSGATPCNDRIAACSADPKLDEEPEYLAIRFESEQMLAAHRKAELEHIVQQFESEQMPEGNLKAEPAANPSDDPNVHAEPESIAQQIGSEQMTAGNLKAEPSTILSDDPTIDAEPECIAQQLDSEQMTAGNLKAEPAVISMHYPVMDQPLRRSDGCRARSPKLDPHERDANMLKEQAMEHPMLDGKSTGNCHEHLEESLTENPTRHSAETLKTGASEDPACSGTPGNWGHPELCARPCFHLAKGQCTRGNSCNFCHLCSVKELHLCKHNRDFLKKTPYQQRAQMIMPLLWEKAASGGFRDQASGLLTKLMPEYRADKVPSDSRVHSVINIMDNMSFRALFSLLLADEAVSDTTQNAWQGLRELRESIGTAQ